MNPELLRDIAERVRLVPDRHRVFDQDTPTVLKIFGIGAPVLSDLLDLGFPHRSSGGERYFDKLDLENVSLSLGLPSPRYLAMRRWPEVLRAVVEHRPVRYDLEAVAECDPAAPVHVCDFRLPAEVLALGTGTDPAARKFTLSREVGTAERPREAPQELQRILTEVSEFRFHILPEALYGDLSFVAETSLADCELATRYLARRATEEGWEARRSFGLLLSSPYSLPHYWPEIRLDGVWTAFDPHLVNSLVRWGVLAPSAVSATQVLNSVFFRIAEDWMPLIQDAGRPARVSVLTRRRSLPDGGVSAQEPAKETSGD